MNIRTAMVSLVAVLSIALLGSSDPGSTKKSGGRRSSVLEFHNSPKRDGVYINPDLTKASASGFHADPSFKAGVRGAVYAQLLYFSEGGRSAKGIVIAATEENDVTALDAASGETVWTRNLGTPVPRSKLPCGNIDPLGITGTPVIDEASKTLFADAMTTPDGGRTKKHLIFALSLEDGSIRKGWPVDVSEKVRSGDTRFDSAVQNQRGALVFLKGRVYVPYGGHYGDCGKYHGWLVGVPVSDPGSPKAWTTDATGGGSWAPSGVASWNGSLFIATGNTFGAKTWGGGESIIRFGPGPEFSGKTADYFAPSDWKRLDDGDVDIGGTGPIIIDVPGATPSKLVVGLGKDGKIYLVDRNNLGGIGRPVAAVEVAKTAIINAAAAYTTAGGTYVVFRGEGRNCPSNQSGDLTAVRIVPGNPPSVETAWCANQHGKGSPMVTTVDGRNEAVVWSVGAEGDNRLHGFDGDTGRVIYRGDEIGKVRRFHTPILANDRIYVAADGVVKAFVR